MSIKHYPILLEEIIESLCQPLKEERFNSPMRTKRAIYVQFVSGLFLFNFPLHRSDPQYQIETFDRLNKRFGKGNFDKLNDEHDLVMTKNRNRYLSNATGYKISDNTRQRIENQAMESLDKFRSHSLRKGRPPSPIRSKGKGAKNERSRETFDVNIKIEGFSSTVPINSDAIYAALRYLKSLQAQSEAELNIRFSKPYSLLIDKQQNSFNARVCQYIDKSLVTELEDLKYLTRFISELITELFGFLSIRDKENKIISTYRRYKGGRFFGDEVRHLMKCRTIVRRICLWNAYEYDFINCHYSIAAQMAEKYRLKCPHLARFVDGGRDELFALAQNIRERNKLKEIAISFLYGSVMSLHPESTLVKLLGIDRAKFFDKSDLLNGLSHDARLLAKVAIDKAPKDRKGRVINSAGYAEPTDRSKEKKSYGSRLSHLLQSIESEALLAAVSPLGPDLLLMQHDGFTVSRELNVLDVTNRVKRETGYELKLKMK